MEGTPGATPAAIDVTTVIGGLPPEVSGPILTVVQHFEQRIVALENDLERHLVEVENKATGQAAGAGELPPAA